jgi:DNA-binding transcriptional LysR family regulator
VDLNLEQFMPDEIVPVCAPRIPDPKLRRAIEGLKSVRNLEALPLIWRESGSGTRAVVESVLKDSGVNPRKLDQRFGLESTEAIKSLVIGVLGWASFPVVSVAKKVGVHLKAFLLENSGQRVKRRYKYEY